MFWSDGTLHLLDQRLLPHEEVWLSLTTWLKVRDAIRDMAVRGAPAIGIAAAYGMALAMRDGVQPEVAHTGLAASRPTAVNLFWALDRIQRLEDKSYSSVLHEAIAIEQEDLALNHAIGDHGATLIPRGARILTICNTGGLATAGHGTALGIIRSAFAQDPTVTVVSCETRPRQQGLRLTAYELLKSGIPFQSIVDSAAASMMAAGKIDLVIAGADRIAANGDTANKIGTYMLAVLAHFHKLPFYIAAPSSTLDSTLADGSGIPIENRDFEEITHIEGVAVAPVGTPVFNPAFDVTPGALIRAIVTETGVHTAPFRF